MMRYACLKRQRYESGLLAVIPVREADMELIRVWRNEQMRVLRQSRPLSPEDQKRYFRDVVMPTFEQPQPPMLLFTYLLDDHPIGYGGLVHIDWENRRAEISFLLETARSREDADGEYARLFSCFLALMKRIAFDELGLNRLYTETFDIRPLHVQVLEQNGFRPEGRMRQHVLVDGRFVDSLIHGCLSGERDYA